MWRRQLTYYLLLTFIAATVILTWVVKIINDTLPHTDQLTRSFVASVEGTLFFSAARLITELGSVTFLVPFIIVMSIVLWILYGDHLPVIIFIGGTVVSTVLNLSIKMLVERERPRLDALANAEGYSFPSGHAMVSIVCYGLLTYLLMLKIKSTTITLIVQYSFALLILFIGMSRVIIDVHYLTDVLAGFTFGFFILLGFIKLHDYFYKQRIVKKAR